MALSYNYYIVRVPLDIKDRTAVEREEYLRALGELAIETARGRARLYCTPAAWTAEYLRENGLVGSTYRNPGFKVNYVSTTKNFVFSKTTGLP